MRAGWSLVLLVPPVVALAIPTAGELRLLAPLLALVLGMPLLWSRRRAPGLTIVGIALVVLASHLGVRVQPQLGQLGSSGAPPTVDLTVEPVPPGTEGPLTARGYLHADWVLDEYAVERGQRPDQQKAARAVLVPLLGVESGEAKLGATLLIARVAAGSETRKGLVELTGRAERARPELLSALLAAMRAPEGADPEGIVLDTMAAVGKGAVWVELGIAIALALFGVGCVAVGGKKGR